METISKGRELLTEGDVTAVYLAYNQKIYNLAYRMTGNKQVAEDITQETFINVFNHYSQFRGDSNISTWIYSIARNACFRYLKNIKKGAFQSIEGLIEKVSAAVDQDQYTEQEKSVYISQVKDGCLLGLLRCLSFNQRIAFILYILNEISIKDVAAILNKSENSTRILVHRARTNLKTFLCRNCSLYQEENHCKCEKLIMFSLKQGWINKFDPQTTPEMIETELKTFKNEIALFKTIREPELSEEIKMKISNLIKGNTLKIFANKKVK